ncbi:MAG: endonuclease/exonuclease/phosphatase family protein [Planctomycetes bacterium]|nr:endonuclease/exonuclease/phosphatase family protein [Planctomycetota bacterium]
MSAEERRAPGRSRPSRVARWALLAGGTACGLGLVAGCFGSAWWVLDLAAHFRVQQVAGLALVALGLVALGARRRGLAFGLLALIGGFGPARYSLGAEQASPASPRLRVASLNVLSGNRDVAEIQGFVRESDADVLLLIEASRKLLDALEPQLRAYPQRLEAPRDDPFGLALYARLPMRARRHDLGTSGMPSIEAELEFGGARVLLEAVHPPPPISSAMALERDRVIGDAVERLCLADEPGILLGDLNTTPWAESLARLAFPRGLRDARRGHGVLPSWPADAFLLRIPIDHCLVRGPLRSLGARLGGSCGSDHLGLVVDLALER